MLNKLLICCFSAPSFEKYVENKYMLMFPSSVIPKIKKKNVVKTCLIDKKKIYFYIFKTEITGKVFWWVTWKTADQYFFMDGFLSTLT
jgi:hypothetical protein